VQKDETDFTAVVSQDIGDVFARNVSLLCKLLKTYMV